MNVGHLMSLCDQITHNDNFLLSIMHMIDEVSQAEVIACYKLTELGKLSIAHQVVDK